MMDHSFESKIINKGRKARQCFLCYSKIEIGESQEVRKGVYGGEFIENRACMKCSRIIQKYRNEVTDCGWVNEGAIQELIDELDLQTHEELELYFDNLKPTESKHSEQA